MLRRIILLHIKTKVTLSTWFSVVISSYNRITKKKKIFQQKKLKSTKVDYEFCAR